MFRGVSTFAMLTGTLPFTVEPFNIKQLHQKMVNGDINAIPSDISRGNHRAYIYIYIYHIYMYTGICIYTNTSEPNELTLLVQVICRRLLKLSVCWVCLLVVVLIIFQDNEGPSRGQKSLILLVPLQGMNQTISRQPK